MWFSGQLAPEISEAFSQTLSAVLGVEVRELTGPTAAPLDGWAALRSGDRIACVFDKFDAVRGEAAPPPRPLFPILTAFPAQRRRLTCGGPTCTFSVLSS